MAINFNDRYLNVYTDYVDPSGFVPSPGGAGDTLNITAGNASVKGFPVNVAAQTSLALTAPAGTGNKVRNYIRFNRTTLAYSVFATAEGATVTALDVARLTGDASSSPDGENHQAECYIAYVDVDDDGTTADTDITTWRPLVLGRGA